MRTIFFTVALLLTTIILMGCGGGDNKASDPTSTKHSKVIVIGVDDEFPPICFHDEKGNLVGFDVDLAKETAKRMGVKFEFKPIDWNNKEAEITSGNVDMIWNGLVITAERKEYMIFSKPYMDNRQIILVHAGNPESIRSFGDLYGKVIGMQAGSSSEAYVKENYDVDNYFKEFKTYSSIEEGFEALEKNKFDAIIIDEIEARYEMNKHPGTFKLVQETVGTFSEVAIGFRKDNTELRDKVQKAFDSMVADGTASAISKKWFQADLIKYRR